MKLLNTAIIRLTLVLLAGIFIGSYTPLPLSLLYFLLAGLLLLFVFFWFRAGRLLLQDTAFGWSSFSLFFVLGMLCAQLHQPGNQNLHYSNQLSPVDNLVIAHISEELKPDKYRKKYVAEVLELNGSKVHGKLLLLLPSTDSTEILGSNILLSSSLKPIPNSANPQQFSYRNFMANRGILFQTEVSGKEFFIVDHRKGSLKGSAQELRKGIIDRLKLEAFGTEELAVIQALLLGERRDLSADTNEHFAAAGVMHILAVSGLHIGILLLLLNRLLSPLEHWKKGKHFKVILLILLLWGYALLTGLSPSVVRAVGMFSFVAVGMQLQRQTGVLNSLFVSLLFLLVLQPQWLFEVGFQLSYLAVFSIVILQPLLHSLWFPSNRFFNYLWSLFTVTLAAQIGVMPLSLYYFHQFPGLFFLSNLLILPFLGIILGVGILIIFLALLNLLPEILVKVYNSGIQLLNKFVSWVAGQENFIFQDIAFSQLQLIAFYALLAGFLWLVTTYTAKRLLLFLGLYICLLGILLTDASIQTRNEGIVFHKNRYTVLGNLQNRHLQLSNNLPDSLKNQAFLRNYQLKRKIRSTESIALDNIQLWGEELILMVDSSSIYRIPGLQSERVLLTGSPKINLERLLRDLKPQEIIADGSNYRSYIERWKATCLKQKIPFHYTGEKGSYVYKLKD